MKLQKRKEQAGLDFLLSSNKQGWTFCFHHGVPLCGSVRMIR
jgi:hypothetical protein